MVDVTFKSGLNAQTLTANALAQPTENQKAHYAAAVATALGNNPIFEIRIGTTVIYSSTVVGTLASSANGIEFPTQFAEPPTTNQANALTDPAAVVVLRNASQSTVELTVPVRVGSGAWLTISKALDGTNPVRTSAAILRPPTILGVSNNEGSPVISIDRLIDDMREYSIRQPRFAYDEGGYHRSAHGGLYGANYGNIAATVNASLAAGHQFQYKFQDYWDEIMSWFWCYAGPGHDDSLMLRLQYGYGIISTRDKDTKVWTDSPMTVGGFDGYKWNGNQSTEEQGNAQMYSTTGDYRTHDDGTNSSRFANDDGCELWMRQYKNRPKFVNCDSVGIIAKCRIINNDNTPFEGASGGCYSVKMGVDMWGRTMPVATYYQDNENGRYWGRGCNGSNGRWVEVTTGDWFSCAMITFDIGRSSGNAHIGDYSAANPYVRTPYVPTEQSIRDDPPSWAV